MTENPCRPQRIQLRREKGWRMPPTCVKVDRSTPYGNPFKVGTHGTAEECVAMFRMAVQLTGQRRLDLLKRFGWQEDDLPTVESIRELRGKDLACWCKDGDPCHADTLIELANKENPC